MHLLDTRRQPSQQERFSGLLSEQHFPYSGRLCLPNWGMDGDVPFLQAQALS